MPAVQTPPCILVSARMVSSFVTVIDASLRSRARAIAGIPQPYDGDICQPSARRRADRSNLSSATPRLGFRPPLIQQSIEPLFVARPVAVFLISVEQLVCRRELGAMLVSDAKTFFEQVSEIGLLA